MQAVKASANNSELICVTLGNRFKVLSTKLAKLSNSFTSGAAQTIWCYALPKLSALVILGIDWLTQINPKINWSQKTIEWTSSDKNVFLEAFGLGRMLNSVGQLNLIGMQQINNMVRTTKGINLCTWVLQCSAHSKLNAAELEKLSYPNGMYFCSYIGVQRILHNQMLQNTPH